MRQPICYVGQEVFCAPHEGAEKTLLSAGSVSRMCQLFFITFSEGFETEY